jgi:hypothetical protein
VLGATEDKCATCGGDGKPCCGTGNNGTCSTGLVCAGRNTRNGTAGTCGARQVDGGVVSPVDAPVSTATDAL